MIYVVLLDGGSMSMMNLHVPTMQSISFVLCYTSANIEEGLSIVNTTAIESNSRPLLHSSLFTLRSRRVPALTILFSKQGGCPDIVQIEVGQMNGSFMSSENFFFMSTLIFFQSCQSC